MNEEIKSYWESHGYKIIYHSNIMCWTIGDVFGINPDLIVAYVSSRFKETVYNFFDRGNKLWICDLSEQTMLSYIRLEVFQ